jgi:1,2-dihydroxy-3-keto-5-methylthiopentene dioxygenase
VTLVQVMGDRDAADVRLRTGDAAVIGSELAKRSVIFGRWPTVPDLGTTTPSDDILASYHDRVAELNTGGRYKHIDVARLGPGDSDPRWPDTAKAAREKFLSEHRHAENEVRFFVAGRGCFYLHLYPEVVAVVCEGGDLLSVPAGTRHWFDMGIRPDFVAIRFFEEEDGWIGDFTGDPIGRRFPTLDQLTAA